MSDPLRKLSLKDGRYAPEAFQFVFEALDQVVQATGREEAEGTERHITGRELLEGMKAYAMQIFGPLAPQVWRKWGVHSTLDWGHIVFLLVEAKLLNRQDTDTIEDFRDGFDFDEAFASYEPSLPPELGASPAKDDG